jgi:hypothetical protein
MNRHHAYLQNINEITQRGDAREESYYESLSHLLMSYAEDTGKNDILSPLSPKKLKQETPTFGSGMVLTISSAILKPKPQTLRI